MEGFGGRIFKTQLNKSSSFRTKADNKWEKFEGLTNLLDLSKANPIHCKAYFLKLFTFNAKLIKAQKGVLIN